MTSDTTPLSPRPGKTLVISSPKGGVGKTTLSRNLAVAAVSDGLSVMMADLDKQRSLSQWWARRPEELTHVDCLAAELADVADVIDAGRSADLLIIDTPTAVEEYPEPIKVLLLNADFVLIPSGVSRDDTESVARWMELVMGFRRPAAFVLTRVNRRAKSFLEARRRLNAAGGRLCPIELPLFEDFNTAAEIGASVLEMKGASGGDDVTGVWRFVAKEMGL